MVENRGIWTDLIKGAALEIAEVFDQAQEEYKPGIGRLLRVESMTGGQANYSGKVGVGELQRFDEGDNLPGGRRYKTYTTKVIPNEYGKFVDVTFQAIEDREFAADLDEMHDLSIAANYSQDASGVQLFNGGFATTIDVNGYRMTWYGDGEPLFSTVHSTVVPGASTQSNASSTSIPFTHDNLEVGYVALLEQLTDDGLAMALLGKPTLVLPPALLKEGEEVTESELDPSTTNNAINVYVNGMACDLAMSVHLSGVTGIGGSNTAWFLTVPQRARLSHIVRQEPRLEQDTNIKNKVATFTVHARWSDVAKDWRRTYGSQGNNAAYSS